ncbi:protein-disulfide reductase DsbD family protein [Vibrio atypicus]|uniref:protein-disulfide reductase DsbD family protein n=1 Tax=Vibrio atypicus TaxID=558271 RepID=UPI00135C66D2|nr:protein-disulfide reductase DsbD domain-containing protein [Vibrio atypicus]
MKNILNLRHFSATLSVMALICSFFSTVTFAASDTGWMTNPDHPPVRTRFVLTGQADPTNQLVEGYLEVELTKDWKTYWRSPGEGGIAPSIDWGASENLKSVDWHWPYPQQFELLGIHTLGYKGDTVIPMTLNIEDWQKPVNIDAKLVLSSCTTICVLTDYPIKLSFTPSDLSMSEPDLFKYAQAISQVPKASPLIEKATAIWDENKQRLEISLDKKLGWNHPEFILDGKTEQSKEYSYKLIDKSINGQSATAIIEVSSWLGDIDLTGESLFVSIKDDNFLAEQVIDVELGVSSAEPSSIITMLGIALLGGLILNIMPCVLPVLGMKLSSVISTQGLARRQVRWQFLASSAGILTSFWLLAGFLLVLKLTGNAVGWGIQFQNPWFIGVMVLVTALFGANMLGLFEIRLSSGTNTWLASKGDNSYAGHFTQGMFATLLATPCSAPFLGTAVAFALAASSLELFAIFTALALGMALPWILVALFPVLATMLPKPGAWMNKVKYLFGAMMLITSSWLLYLLSNHLPLFWVLLVALIGLVWLLMKIKRVHGDKALAISGGSALFVTTGVFILASMTTQHWAKPLPADLLWQPLSNQLIENSVIQGKTVFVNVTADWCVTCKANKIGVILQDPVYSTLLGDDVVPIQGDWTHPDGAVTDYLRANGRYGVPFNIVYGPNAPQGIALPVILTENEVMGAIEKAKGEG